MFGIKELKSNIEITSMDVECPIQGCCQRVERQRRSFRREEKFLCPDHKIYISPSTFEYTNETDNLLWKNSADLDLLEAVKKVKRESRITRDNSEDALTWNTFRFLENTGQISNLLSHVANMENKDSELIYWSYSQKTKDAWAGLNKARQEFGEHLQRSSEPDLIVLTDKALFFIEAKLTASNDTLPSDPKNQKSYPTGGDNWHKQAFVSDFETIAIQAKKYELFRFWLLGSWLAREMNRDFFLLNLVRSGRETDIETRFTPHIQADKHRHFKRLTWEEIYKFIVETMPNNPDKQLITSYFQNKTIGYNRFGELQKAFLIE